MVKYLHRTYTHLSVYFNIGPTLYKMVKYLHRTYTHLSVYFNSGPQPFRHQGLVLWKTILPQAGGGGMIWDNLAH